MHIEIEVQKDALCLLCLLQNTFFFFSLLLVILKFLLKQTVTILNFHCDKEAVFQGDWRREWRSIPPSPVFMENLCPLKLWEISRSSECERGEDMPGNCGKELRVRKKWAQKHAREEEVDISCQYIGYWWE